MSISDTFPTYVKNGGKLYCHGHWMSPMSVLYIHIDSYRYLQIWNYKRGKNKSIKIQKIVKTMVAFVKFKIIKIQISYIIVSVIVIRQNKK